MTYYDILGVSQTATQDQIKQAFRLQVRFFHPDLFEGPPEVAEIKTKQLNEAYGVLGNPELRLQYDRTLRMHTRAAPNPEPSTAYDPRTSSDPQQESTDTQTDKPGRTNGAIEKKITAAILIVAAVICGMLSIWGSSNREASEPEDVTVPVTDTASQTEISDTSSRTATSDTSASDAPSAAVKEPKDEPEAPKAIAKPKSGTILSGKEATSAGRSEITVTADSDASYVVSLRSSNGTERVTFFVRAGETVTVGVPAEILYAYFASGKQWYGYGRSLMFGKDTVYSKDDQPLNFYKYTWEFLLQETPNGNFSETPIIEDEFF